MLSIRWSRGIHFGVLGVGVAALWYFTGAFSLPKWCRSIQRRKQQVTKERLLEALGNLAKDFHRIFSELAQMASSIQSTMKGQGLGHALPIEQMGAMLMEQGFEKRLEECERNVLQKLELTKEDVEAATKRFKEDPEVQLRTVGMKDMYKDAILGILPLLPAAKMPPALSSAETMLDILREIQERKIELFVQIMNGLDNNNSDVSSSKATVPSAQLKNKLVAAAQQAEDDVFKQRAATIESPSSYRHALAFHSRDATFKTKKNELNDAYSEKIVALMRTRIKQSGASSAVEEGYPIGSASESPVIVALRDKLEQVDAKGLKRHFCASVESEPKPIVCLVTCKKSDGTAATALMSLSKCIDTFQERHPGSTTLPVLFLTTTLDDLVAAQLPGIPLSEISAKVTPSSSLCLLFRDSTYQCWKADPEEAMSSVTEWIQPKVQLLPSASESATTPLICSEAASTDLFHPVPAIEERHRVDEVLPELEAAISTTPSDASAAKSFGSADLKATSSCASTEEDPLLGSTTPPTAGETRPEHSACSVQR